MTIRQDVFVCQVLPALCHPGGILQVPVGQVFVAKHDSPTQMYHVRIANHTQLGFMIRSNFPQHSLQVKDTFSKTQSSSQGYKQIWVDYGLQIRIGHNLPNLRGTCVRPSAMSTGGRCGPPDATGLRLVVSYHLAHVKIRPSRTRFFGGNFQLTTV